MIHLMHKVPFLKEQQAIKRLALRSVIFCFILIEMMNIIYFYYDQERFITNQLHHNTLLTTKYFDQKIQTQIKVLNTIYTQIVTNKNVLNAFKSRDSLLLSEYASPYYQQLESIYTKASMHYVLPNNISFLRLHIQERVLDDVSHYRPIIKEVNAKQEAHYGFEAGRFGFFLRYTSPVWDGELYLGALELGISLYDTISEISHINQSDNIIAIHNQFLPPVRHDTMIDSDTSWLMTQGNYGLILPKNGTYDKWLPFIKLDTNESYKKVFFDDKHYLISYQTHLSNFENQTLGRIVTIMDITHFMETSKRSIIIFSLLSVLAMLIILKVLHGSFEQFIQQDNAIHARYEEARDKLRAIEHRLNPHFLVNALNVISELIYRNVHHAEESIVRLSKLLHSYIRSSETLLLHEELSLVEDYFHLQNLRFDHKNSFALHVNDTALLHTIVPKFSLQLLVENAFKHGKKTVDAIKIALKIYRYKDNLYLCAYNTGDGFVSLQKGFGLTNLELRLHELYPSAKLHYAHKRGLTRFVIIIPKDAV